jgi:hypothetical protein
LARSRLTNPTRDTSRPKCGRVIISSGWYHCEERSDAAISNPRVGTFLHEAHDSNNRADPLLHAIALA